MRTPVVARRPLMGIAMMGILLLVFLASCGGEAARGPSSHAPAGSPASRDRSVGAYSAGGTAGTGGAITNDAQALRGVPAPAPAAPQNPASSVAKVPDKIVKTADLGLEVKDGDFDAAWIRVFQTATRFGGYVASSNRGRPQPLGAERTDAELAFGDITIRVPVTRFEAAMNELRKAGKVTGDVSNSEDVTDQYVDLQSRIRHQRAQEVVLVRLMGRARTIGDTLTVQNELSKVQLQIEELSGKLNALNGRADLSTITVHLAEKGAAVAKADERKTGPSFSKAWDTAVVGLKRMATAMVIVIPITAPFLLLGAGAWLMLRRRWAGKARPAEA